MDSNSLLNSLTPEQLQELLGLSTLDEKGGLLEQQMQQAMSLRQHAPSHHTTAGGAIGEGLGNLVSSGVGFMKQGQVQDAQQALLAQKLKGRQAYVDALRRQQPQPEAPPMPGQMSQAELFGLK